MFHIPENILEIYEPGRYFNQFVRIQQVDSIACGNKMTQYYDWKPLPSLTVAETEWFVENELGMVKVEPEESYKVGIQEYLSRYTNLNYVCSYTFPTIEARNRLAYKKEIEDYEYAAKLHAYSDAIFEQKIKETGDPDGKLALSLKYNKRSQHTEQFILMHIYSDKEGCFSDVEIRGMMPKVATFSLYHVLGLAPVPEEVASNWPYYLQFLIDIGYVEDFVKGAEE